jgi:hypothetical protein
MQGRHSNRGDLVSKPDKGESSKCKSGYTGVRQIGNRWQVRITHKGIQHNIGTFTSIEEAKDARAKFKRGENVIKPIRPESKSGVTGVSLVGDRWRLQVNIDGQLYHVGMYRSVDEASNARLDFLSLYQSKKDACSKLGMKFDKLKYVNQLLGNRRTGRSFNSGADVNVNDDDDDDNMDDYNEENTYQELLSLCKNVDVDVDLSSSSAPVTAQTQAPVSAPGSTSLVTEIQTNTNMELDANHSSSFPQDVLVNSNSNSNDNDKGDILRSITDNTTTSCLQDVVISPTHQNQNQNQYQHPPHYNEYEIMEKEREMRKQNFFAMQQNLTDIYQKQQELKILQFGQQRSFDIGSILMSFTAANANANVLGSPGSAPLGMGMGMDVAVSEPPKLTTSSCSMQIATMSENPSCTQYYTDSSVSQDDQLMEASKANATSGRNMIF